MSHSNETPNYMTLIPNSNGHNGNGVKIKHRSLIRKWRKRIWWLNGTMIFVILVLAGVILFMVERWFNRPFTPQDYVKNPMVIDIVCHYELSMDMGLTIDKVDNVQVTAYSNRIEETDTTPDITASDRMVYEGSLAVSQDFIKSKRVHFGDIIYIEKFKKYFKVDDTMNKRYNRSIDIFYFKKWYKGKVDKFGCQHSDIYIIKVAK